MIFALIGCLYAPEAFQSDADAAVCAWKADCHEADEAECIAEAEASWVEPDCLYDDEAARDCVEQLELLQCPTDDEPLVMPSACDAVWAC